MKSDDFKVLMIKLKVDLTPDESELLRYLVYKATDFTAFNARTFVMYLNHRRNFRIKELLKFEAPADKTIPDIIYPRLLKALVTLAHNFGTTFIETSLKPFIYEKNKLELDSIKEFLRNANIEGDTADWVEFQMYLANHNYLSLSDYSNLKNARFYVEIERLVQCLKDNFKILGLKEKEFAQGYIL